MKHWIILTLLAIFYSCSSNYDVKKIHIFLDVTDPKLQKSINGSIITNDIVDAIELNESFSDAVETYIHDMNNLSRSRANTLNLPPDKKGNSMIRKKQIEDFIMGLKGELSQRLAEIKGKESSKLVEKVCSVYESESKHSTLAFIYSDFLQNSENISFYNDNTLEKASTQPIAFAKENLDPICQIDSLPHTTFHLHTLRNASTDQDVNKAEAFWKIWLQSKGAKVLIKS